MRVVATIGTNLDAVSLKLANKSGIVHLARSDGLATCDGRLLCGELLGDFVRKTDEPGYRLQCAPRQSRAVFDAGKAWPADVRP